MLAVVFGTKKFRESVLVQTDYKLLELTATKPLRESLPILQRKMISLQPYGIVVQYTPGKCVQTADTLSKANFSRQNDRVLE